MLALAEDRDLAAAAVRGDREAFRQLIERHYDRVYRIAYRYLGSPSDAEDAAQDVCITLAAKLSHFQRRSRFTTWLTSIVINHCRDVLRRRVSSQNLVQRYGAQRELDEADAAEVDRRSAWLHEALQSLEPTLREAVLLVVAEDFSHAQAARILGCAETTISWRLHTARKRLRARLEHDHE